MGRGNVMMHRRQGLTAPGDGTGWYIAEIETNASEARLREALDGVDVMASASFRRTLGVVRLIARDRASLDRGERLIAAI